MRAREKITTYRFGARGKPFRLPQSLLLLWCAVLCAVVPVRSQNFTNNGSMTNTGTFRVKQTATGLPQNVGGTFEYFGSDQILWARSYQNLALTGAGVKSTQGGDLSVAGNINVAPAVTVAIQSGATLNFGGTLTENGTIKGRIATTDTLLGVNSESNFGNIGVTVKWGEISPGITTVLRHTDTVLVGRDGNTSIKRYYRVNTEQPQVTAEMIIRYADDELNGKDKSKLTLWRSSNDGTTWRRVTAEVDTLTREITRPVGSQTIPLAGLYAVSDSLHPLGTGGIPAVLASAGTSAVAGQILTPVDTIRVVITDADGNPVDGVPVSFAISTRPVDDTSAVLSATSAYTDLNGKAATRLTLGHKTGLYRVIASTDELTGQELIFSATALHGPPVAIAAAEGMDQTAEILTIPSSRLGLLITDIGENPVPGIPVHFAVDSLPTGTTVPPLLSDETALTDTLGIASTQLTLGSKAGRYVITAFSDSVAGFSASFVVTAIPGAPAAWAWNSGGGQQDTIGSQLPAPFTVIVADRGDNPIQNVAVQFGFTQTPAGATEQSVSVSTAQTDQSGMASTTVRLGEKAGPYRVRALFPAIPGAGVSGPTASSKKADNFYELEFKPDLVRLAQQPTPTKKDGKTVVQRAVQPVVAEQEIELTATAIHGKPVDAVPIDVGIHTVPIMTPLDTTFAVRVIDRGQNAVPGTQVRFAVTSAPAEALGYSLTDTLVVTDASGTAATRLVVGSKVGLYEVAATGLTFSHAPVLFTGQARAGTAVRMLASVEGAMQVQPILQPLDTAFTVRILDAGGNGVPSAQVTFAVAQKPSTATGDSINPVVFTDTLGYARATLTLGNKVGSYSVIARSSALPGDSLMFNARAIAGTPALAAILGGQSQVGGLGLYLADSLRLVVRDVGQNPVPNAPVTFAIASAPPNAIGNRAPVLSSSVDTTDENGVAKVGLRLGYAVGTYSVSAQAPSLPAVLFSATAELMLGDANFDRRYDIADLTKVIDVILERTPAFLLDTLYADVNQDGLIDIADALIVRNQLLSGARPVIITGSEPVARKTLPLARSLKVAEETMSLDDLLSGVDSTASALVGADTVTTNVFDTRFTSNLELTNVGVRVVLKNEVPIKGIEFTIRLTRPVNLAAPDVVFERAEFMRVDVRTSADQREVRIVMWNPQNTPIEPGDGALFRLPVRFTSLASVQSVIGIASVDTNVSSDMSAVPKLALQAYPITYKLEQNYPNPFNSSTVIEYEVPEVLGAIPKVAVQVYDILGRRVRTLVEAHHDAGKYRIMWDGKNDEGIPVSSGTYFYRLIAGNHMSAKKMVVIK